MAPGRACVDPGALFAAHGRQWARELRDWQRTALRCPVAAPRVEGGDGGAPRGGDVAVGDSIVEREVAVRARTAVACVAVLLASAVFVDTLVRHGGVPYYFIWLTNWTGMATAVYAVLAARVAREAYKRRDSLYGAEQEDGVPALMVEERSARDGEESVPLMVRVLWCTKAIVPVAQCFITLMFWGLLFRPGMMNGSTVIAHGGLFALVCVDFLLLNRLTFSTLIDVCIVYAYAIVYLVFNVVYTVTPGATDHNGNEWVYGIMKWNSEPGTAGIVVGASLLCVLPLCYGTMCGLTRLRDRRWFPVSGGEVEQ